jgi:alpha-beta hydrolase superfamily lysophospholipase
METTTISGAGGTELHASFFPVKAPRAAVVIVHGLGEHSGRYVELAEFLQAARIAVLTYDQRGHGRSPGIRGHIESWDEHRQDLDAAGGELSRRYPTAPLFLLGHSLGGAIVFEYVLSGMPVPRGVIGSAPTLGADAVSPFKIFMSRILVAVAPRMQLELELDAGNLSRVPGVKEAYLADPLVHGKGTVRCGTETLAAQARVIERAPSFPCPLLVVYGEEDRIASLPSLEEFLARVDRNDTTVRAYAGGQHEPERDLQKDEVFALYRDWILERA